MRPEVRLLVSPGDEQSEPDVLIDGDRVLVTFYGGGVTDQANAWMLSNDGGATWSPEAEYPWYPGAFSSRSIGLPGVVSLGAGRYAEVNIEGESGSTLTVHLGVVTGDMLTWALRSVPVPVVSPASCRPYDSPRLAHDAASGVTYLTYTRNYRVGSGVCNSRIELMRSLDEGLTWSVPITINDPARAASQGAQPVVGPDGELFVVWRDFGASDVRMRRSDDHGITFGPETMVASVLENQSAAPAWSG